MRKKNETPMQTLGRLVKAEAGLSQIKMGDARTLKNLIFEEMVLNMPWSVYEARLARKRIMKREGLKKVKK